MRKHSKKLTALALTAALSLSAFSALIANADESAAVMPMPRPEGASSSDESDVSMREALTKVRQRVRIPAELSDFSYSSSSNNNITSYRFSWTTPDGASVWQSIGVTIVGDIITSYSHHKGDTYEGNPTFAKRSDAELLSAAKTQLQRINPAVAARSEITLRGVNLHGDAASFIITRKFNGLTVSGNSGQLSIDKNTGELIGMWITWWENASFASKDRAISQAQVQAAYKELNTLTPYYKIQTDWETKEKTVQIVYEPSVTYDIDALTGKRTTMQDDASARRRQYFENDVEAEESWDESFSIVNPATGAFTEAERRAISANEKLLTRDQAIEVLRKDKYVNLTSDYRIERSSLFEDLTGDSQFYWTLSFAARPQNGGTKSLEARIDAETGRIISFNKYQWSSDRTQRPRLDVQKANTIATEVMNHYLPVQASHFRPIESNLSPLPEYELFEESISDGIVSTRGVTVESSRMFVFNRYVNDIAVWGDDVRINVNSNDEVMSFNYSYTEDVQFPSASINSVSEAHNSLFKQKSFELNYKGFVALDGKTHTYLVYSIEPYYINAKTGEISDFFGNPLKDEASDVVYSDTKGIAAERAINEFKRHGITLETTGGKFEPNKPITESEFAELVDRICSSWSVYRSYVSENTDKDGNRAPAKNLTRETAAKMLIQGLRLEQAAALKGIYKTPFTDISENNPDIGFIAIAYAKGAFRPDSEGRFNPKGGMTRAQAMQALYGYVSNN
ncbi:MAG: S-layer homology domain-containing protein [Oscillospiraceae bacterium]|nr:S-layer homology domain-containing protein [Oscillospiraceae bacterium]